MLAAWIESRGWIRPLSLLAGVLLAIPSAFAIPIVEMAGYTVDLFASDVGSPTGMTLSPSGDLYVSDYAGGRILRIVDPLSPGPHSYEVVAAGIPFPTDVVFGPSGKLLVSSSTGPSSQILEVSDTGTTQPFASGFFFPVSIAMFGEYPVQN